LVNLPAELTALVGRERELVEVRELFGEGARLITVVGAGGSGKTRLAVRVGSLVAAAVAETRIVFVPLAPLAESGWTALGFLEAWFGGST
jgi:predicted ATPase